MSEANDKEIEEKAAEKSETVAQAEKDPQGEKKDSNKTMMIAMGAVIVAMAVAIGILATRKTAEEEEHQPMRNVVVTPENLDEVIDQINERTLTPPGYYTVNMATEWHFPEGDAVSYDARVDNLAENTNNVYFDVFLASDESTPIYQSPVIPIGGYLEQISLDVPLEMGTYDCVIVYHLVDDAQTTLSTLRVTLTIIVES